MRGVDSRSACMDGAKGEDKAEEEYGTKLSKTTRYLDKVDGVMRGGEWVIHGASNQWKVQNTCG